MSRPSEYPRWADSGGAIVDPTSGKKDVGWLVSEKPAAQFMNWLFNTIYLWILYLETVITGQTSIRSLAVDGTGGAAQTPGATTPLAFFGMTAGDGRFLVDHNGFPMGRLGIIQENWGISGSSTNTNIALNDPRWSIAFGNSGGNNDISFNGASTTNPFPTVAMRVGTNAGDWSSLYSTVNVIANGGGSGAVDAVFETAFKSATSANVNWRFGLHQVPTAIPLSNATSGVFFEHLGSDAHWNAVVMQSGSTVRIDTGITQDGSMHRFRIEFHGANSAYGVANGSADFALFFIDEVLVATASTTGTGFSPSGAMRLFCNGERAGANAITGTLGPMRLCWNLFADPITPL